MEERKPRVIKHIAKSRLFYLTALEKKIIKKIAKTQIQSCTDILNKDTGDYDMELDLLVKEVPQKEFYDSVEKDIKTYEELLIEPHKVFNLPEDDMPFVKHIMFNFVKGKKYDEGKRSIFKKLAAMQFAPFNYN